MKPYFETENSKLFHGDCLEVMKTFPDESINCVITSPPYWQLRDYGFSGQWGLEPTYQEYLNNLWLLMDETKRVLKPDGTVWVNLGDTYGSLSSGIRSKLDGRNISGGVIKAQRFNQQKPKNLEKHLLLLPHRFAIGCIDRGWILRNDITWAKRNAMPESCLDRFSKKHEYLFFMVKRKKYYFDLDQVRTAIDIESIKRELRGNRETNKYANGTEKPAGVHANTMSQKRAYVGYGDLDAYALAKKGRNPGSVSDFWDIPQSGSNDGHYAKYCNDLIDKPIIAGCPEGGIILDPFCGAGTTLTRALQLRRECIGIDGKKEYCEMAKEKLILEDQKGRLF